MSSYIFKDTRAFTSSRLCDFMHVFHLVLVYKYPVAPTFAFIEFTRNSHEVKLFARESTFLAL